MSFAPTFVCNFGNIEVTKFSDIVSEKYVSCFDVAMNDFLLVQFFTSIEQFIGNFPDIVLLKSLSVSLVFSVSNFVLQIASVGILHDDTETLRFVVEEGSFVGDNVRDSD